MELDKRYTIMNQAVIPSQLVSDYWMAMIKADRIFDRFHPQVSKNLDDFTNFIVGQTPVEFYVMDSVTNMLVCEFAFPCQFGECVTVDFSMHPKNTPHQSLHIARAVTTDVIDTWGNISSILGLTPVQNERAVKFIQRCGFKPIKVIPKAGHYRGELCDALLTIKSKEE